MGAGCLLDIIKNIIFSSPEQYNLNTTNVRGVIQTKSNAQFNVIKAAFGPPYASPTPSEAPPA